MAPPRDRPLVVYDGSCRLCRRLVSRLQAWDRRGALGYVALQDPRAEVLTGRPRATLASAVHVVLPAGTVLAGAAALRAVCPYLAWGWLPYVLLGVPGVMPLAERLYRGIARYRGPVGSRLRNG